MNEVNNYSKLTRYRRQRQYVLDFRDVLSKSFIQVRLKVPGRSIIIVVSEGIFLKLCSKSMIEPGGFDRAIFNFP